MEKTIVLYPGLAVSHFVPMMQLAGALLEHGYAVSVALIGHPAATQENALGAAVHRMASSMPSVSIHTLLPPHSSTHDTPPPLSSLLLWYLRLVGSYNGRLHDFLRSTTTTARVHAVIVDSLSVEALSVTKELGIPAYTMLTVNATYLLASIQLPSVLRVGESFKELGVDSTVHFFGLPPMPASHLLSELLQDPEGEAYKATMTAMRRIPEGDGILVNTFESLEPGAVAALRDPRCLPGRVLPPVYCVGPLIGSVGEAASPCLPWLDAQPDRSVVFLCFGSGWGAHSEEQLREIALGLDKSGHRFLWVVRAPDGGAPDLGALLPDGFLERTAGRGLVVKPWAPQVDVLRHRATGAFVTHCGWSSVLEGVAGGVPMLCWPMYAEQRMNKLLMVGEMVGWQQELVRAGEVEGKVRLVMESQEGRDLSARAAAHKECAAVAWKHGGSARAAFDQFLAEVESRHSRACAGEAIDGRVA